LKESKTIKQVVLEKNLLSEEKYNQAVRLEKLVDPNGRN
jgi:fumarate hydratase class II